MNIYRKTIVILIVLSFVILSYTENDFLSELTTHCVATVLSNFVGITPVTAGNILFLEMNNYVVPILISFGCTGFMFISIFALAMFIMPGISLTHRIISILLLPLIYFANIARIVLGVIIGNYTNISMMTFFHDTVGQMFLLIFTVVALVLFLNILGYIKLKRNL